MIIDVSNPLTLFLALIATVLLIFLGKESKKSRIPQVLLIVYLAMLILHVIQLMTVNVTNQETINTLYKCIAIDFVFTLITFLAYLWVDDIEAKSKGKKVVDNSLDWFWSKV